MGTIRPIFRVHAALAGALAVLLLHSGSLAQAEERFFVLDQNGSGSAGMVRQYSASGGDLGVFVSKLNLPAAITADSEGNIYVSEAGVPYKIRKYSASGVELLAIVLPYFPAGVRVRSDGTIYVANYSGGGVYRYSAAGADLGLFASTPYGVDFIEFDATGNLYVASWNSGLIRRFSPTGTDLGTVASLPGVEGIAFDRYGNLYAASYSGGVIIRFSSTGADYFVSTGLSSPYGLAFDGTGNLYVADYGSGTIRKFSSTGTDFGIFASSGLVNPRDLAIVESAVSYACAGFQAPFEEPLSLKRQAQRTLPIQIRLFSDGILITDLNIAGWPPVVKVDFSTNGGTPVDVTDMLVPVGHSSPDAAFGYDRTTELWSFHLRTEPFTAPGTYTVTVAPGDTTYTIDPTCLGQFVRRE